MGKVISDLLSTNHIKKSLADWQLLMWDTKCSGWLGQWKIKEHCWQKRNKEWQWENCLLWYENVDFSWNNLYICSKWKVPLLVDKILEITKKNSKTTKSQGRNCKMYFGFMLSQTTDVDAILLGAKFRTNVLGNDKILFYVQ